MALEGEGYPRFSRWVQINHQDPSDRAGDGGLSSTRCEYERIDKVNAVLALNIMKGPRAKECESMVKVGKTRARVLLWILQKGELRCSLLTSAR